MAARKRVFDPNELLYARWTYEHTDTPNAVIAGRLGCAKSTLHEIIRRERWQPRLQRAAPLAPMPAAAGPSAAPADAAALGEAACPPNAGEVLNPTGEGVAPNGPVSVGADFVGIAAKLAETIEAEIARLCSMQDAGGIAESERIARTAASLARTLRELQSVRAAPPPAPAIAADRFGDDDDMPEDIDEFRNELARRMYALVESRQPQYAGYDG
jgi:hypothetical protein